MTDLATRLHNLSPEKRLLLERLIKRQAGTEPAPTWYQTLDHEVLREPYDVVILGGGLAGSSLALQLVKACPRARILVAERRAYPLPEAAHKVGESTVELGAQYFGEVIGMKRHLQADQLLKLGLRFFFPAAANRDIARRVEVGAFASNSLPLPSYQIDRGRFENAMALESLNVGVTFLTACQVQAVEMDAHGHRVMLRRDGTALTVRARWVVDASGRTGFLKRRLGLAQRVTHEAHAVWLRVGERIDLESWSQDVGWRQRMYPGFRQLSTNHLMGRGYWVWLIPLASNATSVGIVVDAALHPLNRINRWDRALDWLREHEPQFADIIAQKQHLILDFRTQKHYAHGCRQVMSTERWCITGEAGVFTDPFYSPGSDFIAMSNTLITGLIQRDLAGEGIDRHVEFFNWFYLDFMFASSLKVFQYQYPLFGNALVMTAKIIWDFTIYWGVIALLFFQNVLADLDFMMSIQAELLCFRKLQDRVQAFFREWDEQCEPQQWSDTHVDFTQIDFLYQLLDGMQAALSPEQLRAQLAENIRLLDVVAGEMFRKAFGRDPVASDDLYSGMEPGATCVDIAADFQAFWLEPTIDMAS